LVVPEDVVEALIGYTGYLDDAYRRCSPKQIADGYVKCETFFLLNASAEEQIKIKGDLDEQKQRLMI
jgi:hypothetical protein